MSSSRMDKQFHHVVYNVTTRRSPQMENQTISQEENLTFNGSM